MDNEENQLSALHLLAQVTLFVHVAYRSKIQNTRSTIYFVWLSAVPLSDGSSDTMTTDGDGAMPRGTSFLGRGGKREQRRLALLKARLATGELSEEKMQASKSLRCYAVANGSVVHRELPEHQVSAPHHCMPGSAQGCDAKRGLAEPNDSQGGEAPKPAAQHRQSALHRRMPVAKEEVMQAARLAEAGDATRAQFLRHLQQDELRNKRRKLEISEAREARRKSRLYWEHDRMKMLTGPSKRFKITWLRVARFGETAGCEACAKCYGDVQLDRHKARGPHTLECRQRFWKLLVAQQLLPAEHSFHRLTLVIRRGLRPPA